MITQDGRNACLRMNFCGMPTVTWYVKLINQDEESFTDSDEYPYVWSDKIWLETEIIQGRITFTPNSSDVIVAIQLYNEDLVYAEYDLEDPIILEAGKTQTILVPVGWQ